MKELNETIVTLQSYKKRQPKNVKPQSEGMSPFKKSETTEKVLSLRKKRESSSNERPVPSFNTYFEQLQKRHKQLLSGAVD